jgi:hypothetical protein
MRFESKKQWLKKDDAPDQSTAAVGGPGGAHGFEQIKFGIVPPFETRK